MSDREKEPNDGQEENPKNLQDCKMFIGGLHLQTNMDTLKEYFGKWGTILDSVVMRDPNTKRSRGFGFVTYDNSKSVDDCLADRPHMIDGREVEAKRAVPRDENNPMAHSRTKKVFLGGLSLDTSEQEIREMLEQYGRVMDVQIMTDKNTGKPRGFGFAIFDDCDSVDKVCIKKFVRIKERDVEVKKAVSQEEMRKQDMVKQQSTARPYYPRDPYGRDAYSAYGRQMPYDYRTMPTGYDYSRYTAADYMRPDSYMAGGYGMAAYSDRSAAAAYTTYPSYRSGYDMTAAYGAMYGTPTMGTYQQASSTYGPTRSYPDTSGRDRERGPTSRAFHPYRR